MSEVCKPTGVAVAAVRGDEGLALARAHGARLLPGPSREHDKHSLGRSTEQTGTTTWNMKYHKTCNAHWERLPWGATILLLGIV